MSTEFKTYEAAFRHAQAQANATGMDQGLKLRTGYAPAYVVFGLPRAQNRQGDELRCQVVPCEKIENCKPGHGPNAR